MITNEIHIKVYNYTQAKVCVTGRLRGYVFEPANGTIPSMHLLSFEDIEFINSRSSIFRTGGLRFDPAKEEEIFEALAYYNWRDTVLSEADIEDIIFNPTEENQMKVINLKDISTMERIRGKLVYHLNQDSDSISTKNANLIKARWKELRNNKLNSALIVRPVAPAATVELESVKAQNASLQSELDELKQMMAAMMSQMAANSAAVEESKDEAPAEKQSKPAPKTRAPKKKTDDKE